MTYQYVGPAHLRGLRRQGDCLSPRDAAELLAWAGRQCPAGCDAEIPATFVVDAAGFLWIADRRSEHVVCADGGPVLAAGEVVFWRSGCVIEVAEITNQSTGYCPEPECWDCVARVLDGLRLGRPDYWTHVFTFRRCDACDAINIVKDEVMECDLCGRPLSVVWNFAARNRGPR